MQLLFKDVYPELIYNKQKRYLFIIFYSYMYKIENLISANYSI
jgi:hypothetical protein